MEKGKNLKCPTCSKIFYEYMGREEDFRKLCKELNIEIL